MSIIQRFPAALLPLLSIKAGETPQEFPQELTGSLELLGFYLADRLEVAATSTGGISAPQNVYNNVPAGEFWFCYGVTATASNITVGSNVQLQCGISDQAGNNFALAGMTAVTASIAGQAFVVNGSLGNGLLLRPGMRVYAGTLVDPGAGALDLQVAALIARLQSA